MPKSFRIKTDRGVLSFSYFAKSKPGSSFPFFCASNPGLDIGTFFGLTKTPDKLIPYSQAGFKQSEAVVATLPNGNTISVCAQKVDRGWDFYPCLYYIRFYNVSTKQTVSFDRVQFRAIKKDGSVLTDNPQYFTIGVYDIARGEEFGRAFKESTPDDPNKDKPLALGDFVNVTDLKSSKYLADFSDGAVIPNFPGPDNETDPEGGDGDGPDGIEDDPIEIPEDPSLSAANAGLLTLYTPTLSQIHNLGSYLWSDSFSLDTFKKLFSDPMEAIIGLSVVPVSVPTSGAQNIVIGVTDSGVSANRAASQYVTVDCGTISVKPTWNTAIDFEPYTKFSVFLPFIGTREISTDDIMGKDVNIKYLVDVFSGACTAHIKVGGSVLYQFSGSCTTPIPISALSWSNLVTSSIGLLAGGTAAAAAGGVAGGVALAAMTAGAVARSKPTIQRAGNVSGAAGMLGVRVPYLIRETPRQSLAKDYNKFVGYPSNITSKLADLKGYTQVENVHLEGIPATGDELSEIESLLKEGVIL